MTFADYTSRRSSFFTGRSMRHTGMRRGPLAAAALMCGLLPPALAHHSGAMFDSEKILTLRGNVKEFQWTNPHCWIQLLVSGDGGESEWSVEMAAPGTLSRLGWHKSTLKPGDTVSVQVHPLKTGEKGGGFVSVTLADGRTLTARPMPPVLPPGEEASAPVPAPL